MRDYGRVYGTFWSSPTVARLSPDGRTLALYLLTCPHSTIAGVFRLPDGYVAEDLKWPVERVQEPFGELFANGFANRCETTKWVWVVKHLKWNPPDNPNQRKAAAKMASAVPDECTWKRAFYEACGPALGLEPLAAGLTLAEPLGQPFANQKQEQKQEQQLDQKQVQEREQKPAARGSRHCPPGFEVTAEMRAWAQKECPGIDIERETAVFRVHERDKAVSDWPRAWQKWMLKAVEFASKRTGRPQQHKHFDAQHYTEELPR